MEQELNQRVIIELGTLKLQVIDLQTQLKYANLELEQYRANQAHEASVPQPDQQ